VLRRRLTFRPAFELEPEERRDRLLPRLEGRDPLFEEHDTPFLAGRSPVALPGRELGGRGMSHAPPADFRRAGFPFSPSR